MATMSKMQSNKPRTIADFRAAHDPDIIVPAKFKAAFEAMEKLGPEHFLYENEFQKLAGVGQAQLAAYRDQFSMHITETPEKKRVYWPTAKVASRMRIKL